MGIVDRQQDSLSSWWSSAYSRIAHTPSDVTGASFVTQPPAGTPYDVVPNALTSFPTDGSTYAILTSGDATLADTPNSSPSTGANVGGPSIRGNTDFDVTILKIDLAVPAAATQAGPGTVSVHFGVKVSSTPGAYFNNAGAAATGNSATPTGPTAKTTVTPAVNFTLTVTKAGAGSGTVTSSPAGIDCGATSSTQFTDGTVVTLTATAALGSTFAGWSGEGCSGTGTCVVTMSAAPSVTATFDTVPTHTLTVTKTGSGSVTSAPAGIDCGATCSASSNDGTMVTLTATAASGSTFTGWSGAGCSGTGTRVVTMDQDRSVTATFQAQAPGDTASSLKQDALAGLRSLLPSGSMQTDRKLRDAITHVLRSLAAKYWLDDMHLKAKGKRVFMEEKHAVDKLKQIKNPRPGVGDAIDKLVQADGSWRKRRSPTRPPREVTRRSWRKRGRK